jgi:hypothetical protein
MAEEKVDLNKKVDELEAATKKYASKDTLISIGGYEFTPAKLMVAATIVSTTLGGLYGAFEVYKDYMSMKDKIAKYVSPDLSAFDKRLAVLEEGNAKAQQSIEDSVSKSAEYTRDIKNDLKNDIRRLEGVVEAVERSAKQSQRETDVAIKDAQAEMRAVRKDMDANMRSVDNSIKASQRELDNQLKATRKEVDDKIKKALDNPLANK